MTKNIMGKLYFFTSYYNTPNTRNICHLMKRGDENTLKDIAKIFSCGLPRESFIVPVPSSKGYATYTKLLCDEIIKLNRSISICDIVKGAERQSLYDFKKENWLPNKNFFSFYLTSNIPKFNKIFFIDNVFSTGSTFYELSKLLPSANIMTYSYDETIGMPLKVYNVFDKLNSADLDNWKIKQAINRLDISYLSRLIKNKSMITPDIISFIDNNKLIGELDKSIVKVSIGYIFSNSKRIRNVRANSNDRINQISNRNNNLTR